MLKLQLDTYKKIFEMQDAGYSKRHISESLGLDHRTPDTAEANRKKIEIVANELANPETVATWREYLLNGCFEFDAIAEQLGIEYAVLSSLAFSSLGLTDEHVISFKKRRKSNYRKEWKQRKHESQVGEREQWSLDEVNMLVSMRKEKTPLIEIASALNIMFHKGRAVRTDASVCSKLHAASRNKTKEPIMHFEDEENIPKSYTRGISVAHSNRASNGISAAHTTSEA